MAKCVRCGKSTGATYCADCQRWREGIKALLDTAAADAELLSLVDGDTLDGEIVNPPMSKAAVARKLHVSAAAIGQRVRRARRRAALRKTLRLP